MAELSEYEVYQKNGEKNIATLRKQVAQVEQVITDFETEI
jgi:Fe-S oxidoreductase